MNRPHRQPAAPPLQRAVGKGNQVVPPLQVRPSTTGGGHYKTKGKAPPNEHHESLTPRPPPMAREQLLLISEKQRDNYVKHREELNYRPHALIQAKTGEMTEEIKMEAYYHEHYEKISASKSSALLSDSQQLVTSNEDTPRGSSSVQAPDEVTISATKTEAPTRKLKSVSSVTSAVQKVDALLRIENKTPQHGGSREGSPDEHEAQFTTATLAMYALHDAVERFKISAESAMIDLEVANSQEDRSLGHRRRYDLLAQIDNRFKASTSEVLSGYLDDVSAQLARRGISLPNAEDEGKETAVLGREWLVPGNENEEAAVEEGRPPAVDTSSSSTSGTKKRTAGDMKPSFVEEEKKASSPFRLEHVSTSAFLPATSVSSCGSGSQRRKQSRAASLVGLLSAESGGDAGKVNIDSSWADIIDAQSSFQSIFSLTRECDVASLLRKHMGIEMTGNKSKRDPIVDVVLKKAESTIRSLFLEIRRWCKNGVVALHNAVDNFQGLSVEVEQLREEVQTLRDNMAAAETSGQYAAAKKLRSPHGVSSTSSSHKAGAGLQEECIVTLAVDRPKSMSIDLSVEALSECYSLLSNLVHGTVSKCHGRIIKEQSFFSSLRARDDSKENEGDEGGAAFHPSPSVTAAILQPEDDSWQDVNEFSHEQPGIQFMVSFTNVYEALAWEGSMQQFSMYLPWSREVLSTSYTEEVELRREQVQSLEDELQAWPVFVPRLPPKSTDASSGVEGDDALMIEKIQKQVQKYHATMDGFSVLFNAQLKIANANEEGKVAAKKLFAQKQIEEKEEGKDENEITEEVDEAPQYEVITFGSHRAKKIVARGPRLRSSIHCGDILSEMKRCRYDVNPFLSTASCLCALAFGGETVVSDAVITAIGGTELLSTVFRAHLTTSRIPANRIPRKGQADISDGTFLPVRTLQQAGESQVHFLRWAQIPSRVSIFPKERNTNNVATFHKAENDVLPLFSPQRAVGEYPLLWWAGSLHSILLEVTNQKLYTLPLPFYSLSSCGTQVQEKDFPSEKNLLGRRKSFSRRGTIAPNRRLSMAVKHSSSMNMKLASSTVIRNASPDKRTESPALDSTQQHATIISSEGETKERSKSPVQQESGAVDTSCQTYHINGHRLFAGHTKWCLTMLQLLYRWVDGSCHESEMLEQLGELFRVNAGVGDEAIIEDQQKEMEEERELQEAEGKDIDMKLLKSEPTFGDFASSAKYISGMGGAVDWSDIIARYEEIVEARRGSATLCDDPLLAKACMVGTFIAVRDTINELKLFRRRKSSAPPSPATQSLLTISPAAIQKRASLVRVFLDEMTKK